MLDINYFDFDKSVAYHFDATKFAIWLRDTYCIPKGVKHIKEDVVTIEQNKEGIVSLNKKLLLQFFHYLIHYKIHL